MPYVNPIIGYWDGAGYTHCVDCRDIPTPYPPDLTPIDSGNSAVIGSICGWCGTDIGALYDPSNRVKATPE